MILFAAYLQRVLRRRRASRAVPRPGDDPGLARMIVDELVVLAGSLTDRVIATVRREDRDPHAPGDEKGPGTL